MQVNYVIFMTQQQTKINVLAFTRYSTSGASSRLRIMQFIPILNKHGISVATYPLFNEKYIQDLYSGRRNLLSIFLCYLNRVFLIVWFSVFNRNSIIWIEKELLPYFPALIERFFFRRAVKVYDYDDAIFHQYGESKYSIVRLMLKNKIISIANSASLIIVGNEYIAGYLRDRSNAKVIKLPTCVDISSYNERSAFEKTTTFRVGWIGTPNTWNECFLPFSDLFRKISDELDVEFKIIGAGKVDGFSDKFSFVDWSDATDVQILKSCDIGIMPLPDTPWMYGKSAYKIVQYMAAGLPAVASNIGENNFIIDHGIDGFLTHSEKCWATCIKALIDDPKKLQKMQKKALIKATDHFDRIDNGHTLSQLFVELKR